MNLLMYVNIKGHYVDIFIFFMLVIQYSYIKYY